jgi:hypothetical protein
MEAARTSETSVDNHFTRQYNPEDSSEHHTRRRENLKSHRNLLIHIWNSASDKPIFFRFLPLEITFRIGFLNILSLTLSSFMQGKEVVYLHFH